MRIPIVQRFFQLVFLPWKICSGQLKSIKDRLSGFFMPPFFYITMDIIVTLVKEYRQPMWPPRSCPLLMIKKNALNFNTFLSGMRKNGSMSNSGTPSCRNGKKPVGKGNKMVRKLNHRIKAKIISNDFFTHFNFHSQTVIQKIVIVILIIYHKYILTTGIKL